MEVCAGSYWKHVKRGTFYKVLGLARMQIGWMTLSNLHCLPLSLSEELEKMEFVTYQALKDGSIWVRPLSEFTDGRFVEHK